jgi:hypothetical protein
MWGPIVAPTRPLPEGSGTSEGRLVGECGHVETLCALVICRDWIDQEADDPRYELAFQAQLADYRRELRQEGGGVARAWRPGRAPDEWRVH